MKSALLAAACAIKGKRSVWFLISPRILSWNNNSYAIGLCLLLVFTYVAWGTICDAKASRKWQGKICAQIPHNTLFWNLVQNTHRPPPSWKLKCKQILALWLLTSRTPPSPSSLPRKLKFRQILVLWDLTPRTLPIILKFRQMLAVFLTSRTHPPHPSVGWSMWRLITVSPKDNI